MPRPKKRPCIDALPPQVKRDKQTLLLQQQIQWGSNLLLELTIDDCATIIPSHWLRLLRVGDIQILKNGLRVHLTPMMRIEVLDPVQLTLRLVDLQYETLFPASLDDKWMTESFHATIDHWTTDERKEPNQLYLSTNCDRYGYKKLALLSRADAGMLSLLASSLHLLPTEYEVHADVFGKHARHSLFCLQHLLVTDTIHIILGYAFVNDLHELVRRIACPHFQPLA